MSWLDTAVERIRAFAYYKRPDLQPDAPASRPRIGLALGGGFARGIAHIGVLKVLQENNVKIDCVAGTSVGALIGTLHASGTSLEAMQQQAAATQFKDFGTWTLSWLGLASNAKLADYLQRSCSLERFEDMQIPLAIAATDLGSGQPVYFTSGEICPALRASCAYPGLFLPVEHQGRLLVDGFLAAPVPVDAVRMLDADIIIAVYLESGGEGAAKPKNLADVIGRSFSIMQDHARQTWRQKADVVIEPDVRKFEWDDFRKTPELIAAGEAAARAALPQIISLLNPPAQQQTAVAD